MESRELLAADLPLQISEIHFDPTFGDSEVDQYFELRGTPNASIPSGTYLAVVEGGAGSSDNPGVVNSVFDLGGLALGSDGYLVVSQGDSAYPVSPNATHLQGQTGFAGLPGDRFSDNASLSDRFEFIFDSNTFLLMQSATPPLPDFDADQNNDGQIDTIGWTELDSVAVLGTHNGGTQGDLAYSDIVFRAQENVAPQSQGTNVVDVDTVTYVARVTPGGSTAADWMAGETREVTEDQFDFELFARSGNERYRSFVGRQLDHVGSPNFFSTLSGTRFNDENGNGNRDAGESVKSGSLVYLDYNSDGQLGSYETVAEPDSFAVDAVLTNVFPGVTLTTADDENKILSFDIVAEDVAEASTGSLAFSQGTRRLMMDFANPASSVSIDFSAGFSSRRGIMEAYDIDGNLLDAYLTQTVTESSETMTVFSNQHDIAYAVAYADEQVSPFGTLDNLRFTQPELSSTTDSQGDFEIDTVVERPGVSMDVRTVADIHDAVTSPVGGKHSVLVEQPTHFMNLDLGSDSRQPYDIVGRTNTGSWWAALSDTSEFTNVYQTNWSTAVVWSDVMEGQFQGGRSETIGRNGDELWVSENDTTVTPKFWGALPYSTNWVDVKVGDLNGDLRSDWVGRHNGEWWVAESRSDNSFQIQQWSTWSTGVEWEDVVIADFNGDGKDDLAGRANGDWWVAVSTGSPFNSSFQNQNWAQWSNQVQWEDVMTGDFNGDGFDDIAGRANGDWWISRSNGSAFVTEYWGQWSPTAQWDDVLVADFNGDGKDDIAGRTSGGWWVSESVNNFFATSRWAVWSTAVDWLDVAAADFNGDGRDDIAGRANGDWWVAQSNGQTFATAHWGRWSNAVTWVDVQVGRFGDGAAASGSSIDIEVAGKPGDVNFNGKVGFEDFLIVSDNYGDEVEVGLDGDVDGDGVVAFADFLIVSANFGT